MSDHAIDLPDGDRVYLTDAQAAWIEPLRDSRALDARREISCDGCTVFGLCSLHAAD